MYTLEGMGICNISVDKYILLTIVPKYRRSSKNCDRTKKGTCRASRRHAEWHMASEKPNNNIESDKDGSLVHAQYSKAKEEQGNQIQEDW